MTSTSRNASTLRSVLALTVVAIVPANAELTAQAATKRALTANDYDSWPALRSPTYSRDGKWMAYGIKPRVGDGVLYVRQVDGDKVYQFDRGEQASFSNDNQHVFFKVARAYAEQRLQKLKKLHAKKEEGEEEEEAEVEGEFPPDIKKALEERGMPERVARRMMQRRGASLAEIRSFLGLAEPEKKSGGGKKSGKKEKEEDKADKAAKALAKRLHILDLKTGEVTEIERVKSHRQPKNSDLLILHFEKPEPPKKKKDKDEEKAAEEGEEKKGAEKGEENKGKEAEKKGGEPEHGTTEEKKGEQKKGEQKEGEKEEAKKKADPKEKKRSDGTKLVVRDLANGKETTIEHVRAFGLIADDEWMWYTVGTKKMKEGVAHGLFARELATGNTRTLLPGYSNTAGMVTDHDDKQLAFTSDLRTFGDKKPKRDIYLWDFSDKEAHVIIGEDAKGIADGLLVQGSGLDFSHDGSVIAFQVKPPKKEDLPKILKEDEVKLDLWHWQDGLLQTMQAKRGDPSQASMTAVYHRDADKAVVLGTQKMPRLTLITDDGSRALASDSSRYEKMVTWDGRYSDHYVVNTIDGSRTLIVEGLRGSVNSSTGGRYVIWFDHRDYDWHTYDLHDNEHRNLTANIDVAFDREQDDRPEPHRAHGSAGWTKDDAEVLLNDEFDIWAINPATGEARCITDGFGRATNTRLRYANIDLRPDAQRDDNEKRRWLPSDLVLTALDQNTYATGYYTDSLEQTGRPRKLIMKDSATGRPTRPRDADRLFLTFSRFDEFPDIWTTDLAFAGARKLTDACPIRRQVRWGSAELVTWRSDDGVDLKGYLVKPDGFDPEKKYPMMVYFYERSSQSMHRFVSPNASTSPNAAFYVANGYLWFVPDIVYRDGYPGESCEKCVVSGVQHIISMGFVDRDGIGVAGHSWGGYQTAHLITRTDIFAAAESGAPVVNMYSAYGGIRWSSGMSRQFQYEQTQSRIGGSIWEHPMRYWENSPLFHLDKANTPVLILHNDEDGAVPWYQGIEFFVAMRRLGKEAYLMNYNGEAHGLRKRQNQRDWTRRMKQFFDHHLKGAPAPEWMKRGVPYHERLAEKIPHAPSYREAIEAGLIEQAADKKKPTATPAEASTNQGSR